MILFVEQQVITDDGVSITYGLHEAAQPSAPRIALVHSLALDHSFWNPVATVVEGSMALLAIDCRGHGRSGRSSEPFTADRMADDLAIALDHAGWDRAVIAGCSMGGCVAMAFAARHPGRTAGLVAIDTTAWYGPDAPEAWVARGARARSGGMAALLPFQHDRWLSPAFRAGNPEVEAAADAVFLRTDVTSYEAACAMLGAMDLRDAIKDIQAPTTVLVGSDDTATPPAMAEEIARRIPRASLQVLAGARHLTPLERPDQIVAALRRNSA